MNHDPSINDLRKGRANKMREKNALTQLRFQIDHLGCTSCAGRMEEAIGRLPGVRHVRLDFATADLQVEMEHAHDAAVLTEKIQAVISGIEKDACLVETGKRPDAAEPQVHTFKRKAILRLLSGTVIFVLPWIFTLQAPVPVVLWLGAYLILGSDVVLRAARQIWRRQWFDEHFLMSLATLGALAIGEYPEAVAVMLFYQTGDFLQSLAVDHSRRSVRALLAIRPDRALRLTDRGTEQVSPGEMAVGDKMLIRPGDRVALDSQVLDGRSELDTAALTGESSPVPVGPGDEIRAGYVNGSGLLTAVVMRPEAESSVSRILQLVEEAAARKAPAERFITRFARVYTPVMVGLALTIAFLPPLILQQPFADWIYRALILLVISCPCALVLSIPLGYFAGIGKASASGILVKGGQYLDRLAAIKTMAWDKTGTLTSGSYAVNRVMASTPGDEPAILEWAALAEHGSSHPLARSIVLAWQEAGGAPPDAGRIKSADHLPGLGLSANIDGHRILLGNLRLLQDNNISADILTARLQTENPDWTTAPSGTLLYLAIDGKCAGLIELTDEMRPEADTTIRQLRQLGISEHILLSGDQSDRVAAIAARAGLDDYKGGLLPEQKVAALEALIASGKSRQPIAYIGDGINDTPILARADLSVALGGGSDAALENADIVIIGDDLSKLPPAVRLARKTGRIVRQNIAIALGFKFLIVLLALIGFSGIWQAVFADVGVALIAVLNALRILRKDRLAATVGLS